MFKYRKQYSDYDKHIAQIRKHSQHHAHRASSHLYPRKQWQLHLLPTCARCWVRIRGAADPPAPHGERPLTIVSLSLFVKKKQSTQYNYFLIVLTRQESGIISNQQVTGNLRSIVAFSVFPRVTKIYICLFCSRVSLLAGVQCARIIG